MQRIEVRKAIYTIDRHPRWNVYRDGTHLSGFGDREDALAFARRQCAEIRRFGFVVELSVRDPDGGVSVERFELAQAAG